MIKNIIQMLCIYILSYFIIAICTIQVINANVTKELGVTLDLRLIWFKGNNELFISIALLSLIPCLAYLINFFVFSHKGNKENYNKLMTKREAKKNLLEVTFNDHFYLTPKDHLKIMLSKPTSQINESIANSAEHNALASFLFQHNIKLPEVKKYMINNKVQYKYSGIPIITYHNKVYLDPTDSHNLVVGTTNSGKTFSLLLEMIELTRMAGQSAIVVDLKGELSQQTYWKFKEDGYDCYCIDFINPSFSDSWNPLELGFKEYEKEKERVNNYILEMTEKINHAKKHFESRYGKSVSFYFNELNENGDRIVDPQTGEIIKYENFSKAEEYFADVCNAIFTCEKGNDAFWYDSASVIALGAIFFLAEEGNKDYVNLGAVQKLIDLGDMSYAKKMTYFDIALDKMRNTDDLSFARLLNYAQAAEGTKKSIKSVFSTVFNKLLLNQDVKNMMASNDIDLTQIGNKKTVIFLKVHDEKSIYYPLVNLFMNQIYECLIANARENTKLRLKVPINILWDEFGSSPAFDPILNLLSAGRSRGILSTLVVQGYDQLESKYGKEKARTIKNNVMNKVYLLSGDTETLKEFSELAGKKKIYKDGKDEDVPLFSTERLSKFKLGEALFIRQRLNPFYTTLLGYNKYDFYSTKTSEFTEQNHPMSKFFDLKKYIDINYPPTIRRMR